ncbi:MAG: hypothetical protein ACOVMR_06540, partial [Flavobacteriales bacterium]
MRFKHILLIIIAGAMGLNVMAQRDSIINMESEFEGERKLFLRDANKLTTNPVIKEQMVEMVTIRYSTLPTR